MSSVEEEALAALVRIMAREGRTSPRYVARVTPEHLARIDVYGDRQPREGVTHFAVRTNPKCERRAMLGLERRGLAVYTPIVTRQVARSRQTHSIISPLFPRYLFVGIEPDILSRRGFLDLRRVDGVESLVRNQGKPVEIPHHLLESLARSQAEGAFDQRPSKPAGLQPGQQVRIKAGPFAEFVATVERANSKGRVKALVSLFGRLSSASFNLAELEAF